MPHPSWRQGVSALVVGLALGGPAAPWAAQVFLSREPFPRGMNGPPRAGRLG